ncbi:hypothetical protein [Anaerocellum danielii]|uniref:Uncharacterized protein n=1 Tax=Anaerocellum danielii TaxID=1387557 RepID=A0ABZ0TYN6_9FIRM|nr:hypothetical protein [Caldicellulosiruptor danielii]WPX08576.1 hypothetical protein SOJ16_002473 [Caldicellulosiruptor danielii]
MNIEDVKKTVVEFLKEYALLNEEREAILKSLFEGSKKLEC